MAWINNPDVRHPIDEIETPNNGNATKDKMQKASTFFWEKSDRFGQSRPAYDSAGKYINTVQKEIAGAGNIFSPEEQKKVASECFFAQAGFELDMGMALGLTDPKEREKAIQEAFTTFLDNVDKALGLLEAKNAKMTEPKGSKDSRKEERMQLFLKEVEATRAEFAQAKVVADQKQAAAAQKAGNIEARAAWVQAESLFAGIFTKK